MAFGKKKLKIGILTQPLHMNYGGILQAWALQQFLKEQGLNCITIARYHDAAPLSTKEWIIQFLSFSKTVVHKIINPFKDIHFRNPFNRAYRAEMYSDKSFVKRIKRSSILSTDAKLRKYIDRHHFDAFIVGSDQVWREEYSPNIETYFLDFLSGNDRRKKISYSASFGVEEGYISEKNLPNCINLLRRFDAVSVREDGGLKIIKNTFKRSDAVKVLDPTLLLSKDDYSKIIKSKDKTNDKYIAEYILDDSPSKLSISSEVQSSFGVSSKRVSLYSGEKTPTMSQWLSLFADAEFVVTDSFHGCVFSVLFQKPFIAIGNESRGLDRFTSLLSMFGLMDRLILTEAEFYEKKESLLTPIYYTEVDKILERERRKSLDFLRTALNI